MDARTGSIRTVATSLTTAALAVVSLPASAETDHVVAPGDTVSSLASTYGVPSARIIAANDLDAKATIRIGEHLTIPGAAPAPADVVHVVVAGDAVWDLAATYGVSVSAISEANSLDARATIRIGQRLVIPSVTAPSASPTRGTGTHTVRKGDTLWSIARAYHTTVISLARANGIDNPALVRIGAVLTVPSQGSTQIVATSANLATTAETTLYVVRSGDTLSAIAARHRTTVDHLARTNHLTNPSLIRVGQTLTVPGGVPTGLVGDTFLGRTYPDSVVSAANVNKATLNAMSVPTRAQMQTMVIDTARRMGVDPALAQAIAYQESGFNQRAVSPANAVGCMQVIPTSGEWASDLVGRDLNLLIAQDNVTAGVAILRQLQRNGAPLDIAIAGYYQGERSVRENGMNSDTVRYVASVKSLMARFD